MQGWGLNKTQPALRRIAEILRVRYALKSLLRITITAGLVLAAAASDIPGSNFASQSSSPEIGSAHLSTLVAYRGDPCFDPEYRPRCEAQVNVIFYLFVAFLFGLEIGLLALPRAKPPPEKTKVKAEVEKAFKKRIDEAKAHLLPQLDKMLERAQAEVLAALKKLDLVD